jgi:arabinose-5-phosphate isomerase
MKRRFKHSMNAHIEALLSVVNIEDEKVDSVIRFITESDGLFMTGVGKNADLMYKISKTFNSVSIRSYFIDPVNAVHGDIGMIPKGSSIIASSKSGNTEELTRFLISLKKLNENHRVLLIHCNESLVNVDYADELIYIPIQNEADHLNIVPTVSLCAIETFLHSVACEVIENSGFKKEDMSRNHPAGNLGRICAS